MDDILEPGQAADFLGFDKDTLAKWRYTRRYALKYIKVGGRIRYRRSDLEDFLKARTVEGTEAPSVDLKAKPFTPKNPRAKKPSASRKQLTPAGSRRRRKA